MWDDFAPTGKTIPGKDAFVSKLEQENVYHGRILDVARELHRMPDGREARFEIIQHPGGAAALPVMADGRLVLIRQFRPAAGDYIYEIPAGRLEPGENPAECVARELEEEIGYRPLTTEALGFVYSSVGFCTEKIHLFIARDLETAQTALEPDEYIEPFIVTVDEALALVTAGRITDAKTQIALLRYELLDRRSA